MDTLVEKFGWPGMLLLFVMYEVEYHGTEQQKQALIDMYLLGRGISAAYPIIIMGAVCVTVLFAQRFQYQKRLGIVNAELARLGGEKSLQQEKALGTRLHHSPATGK